MTNFIEREAAQAVRTARHDISRILRHPDTSAETPAAAVTINTSTPGGPVSLAADMHEIAAKIEAGAARIETFGEDVAADVEAIQADPEFAQLFTTVRSLVRLGPASGMVSIVGAGLTTLEQRLLAAKQQREQQGAAGPQVAGQA